jgi:hypothetical protein
MYMKPCQEHLDLSVFLIEIVMLLLILTLVTLVYFEFYLSVYYLFIYLCVLLIRIESGHLIIQKLLGNSTFQVNPEGNLTEGVCCMINFQPL